MGEWDRVGDGGDDARGHPYFLYSRSRTCSHGTADDGSSSCSARRRSISIFC